MARDHAGLTSGSEIGLGNCSGAAAAFVLAYIKEEMGHESTKNEQQNKQNRKAQPGDPGGLRTPWRCVDGPSSGACHYVNRIQTVSRSGSRKNGGDAISVRDNHKLDRPP